LLTAGSVPEMAAPCDDNGPSAVRESGGTGRRAGFRFQWGNLWGFESPLSHHDTVCYLEAERLVRACFLQTYRRRRPLLVGVEELEGWKRRLTISLPEAEVTKKANELLDEIAKDATVPGFRKGKVPRERLQRVHGPATRAEALTMLAGKAYSDAVREADLHPICDPEVELGNEVKDGQYTLRATVEVRPEIELKDYENLEFTERVPIVTNEDVERYLEGLREEHAELIKAERPAAEGDIVVMDYEALGGEGAPLPGSKSEDFVCEVGRNQVPHEIEEALKGMEVGDGKTVAVKYPDDFPTESLAGKEISFKITVKDVRAKLLPSIDDDFAKRVGPFETMLDLRVRVRNGLEAQAKSWARQRLEEEIVRELIDRNPFVLPDCLVEDRMKRMYARAESRRRGGDEGEARASEESYEDVVVPEEFAKVYRPVVEHQLKAGLLLGKVAETHGTEVTTEDIEERVGRIAEAQGGSKEALLSDLAGTEALSQLEDEIWLEKVHDLLVGVSNIKTEPLDLSKQEDAESV
jgi:trigger factor